MELLDGIVEEASDAVDTIQNVYDTLHDAADEYAQSGFITVDTLQSIIGLGQKYVAYLIDENGQLVINEERIQAVIAARTQQMAIESSLAYVEALRMAKSEGDIATLNNLLYATERLLTQLGDWSMQIWLWPDWTKISTRRRCGISMQFGLWRTAPCRALVKLWVA